MSVHTTGTAMELSPEEDLLFGENDSDAGDSPRSESEGEEE